MDGRGKKKEPMSASGLLDDLVKLTERRVCRAVIKANGGYIGESKI